MTVKANKNGSFSAHIKGRDFFENLGTFLTEDEAIEAITQWEKANMTATRKERLKMAAGRREETMSQITDSAKFNNKIKKTCNKCGTGIPGTWKHYELRGNYCEDCNGFYAVRADMYGAGRVAKQTYEKVIKKYGLDKVQDPNREQKNALAVAG